MANAAILMASKRITLAASLKASLKNADWLSATWADAVAKAIDETGLDDFPEDLPWAVEEVLSQDFFPDQ